jgi:hypothetical protein
MIRVLLLIIFLSSSVKIFSQASDFIVVKKRNGRTIKTFFPGLSITFETTDKRGISGTIAAIRHDSIFVREYDIRPVMGIGNVPTIDTLGTLMSGFYYKEIEKVDVSDRMGFSEITPGRILIIGGAGYALLNVINGAYLHQSITSSKNLTSLGIAAGAVGAGLLANYIKKHANKYHVEYVHMDEVKKRGF